MQALYAFELSGGETQHIIDTVITSEHDAAEDIQFARALFLRTLDGQDEANEVIRKRLKNWDFDRIALIDRILLRMSVTEMLYFEDIPPKVTINEAIEIAKRFSTPKSGHFINGLLDAIRLDLQQENRIRKSGRGLIGMLPGSEAPPSGE